MRHYVANVGLVFLVGGAGCSVLYDPGGIATTRPVDAEIIIDADHSMISVTDVFPPAINEAAGDDNSRPAVVALQGSNFEKAASANLTVSVTGWAGLQVMDSKISTTGNYIVLAVHVPFDGTCNAGTSKPLTVTVTKNDGAGGTVSSTLPAGKLQVTCLDELSVAPTASNDPPRLYSNIKITTSTAYTAAAGTKPAILRAVSSITIADVNASAKNDAPGPGGNSGGAKGANGGGPGHGGGTNSGGGGGGGGFVAMGAAGMAGVGAGGSAGVAQSPADPWIASYTTNVSSGGGGAGEVGGGGGGTLEISAGGDLKVGNVSADGAAGTSAPSGITLATGGGGGGTGGVIVLRSGGTITAGSTSVVAGGGSTGGLGGGNGGAGSVGRVRVDSAAGTLPTGPVQIGPMFTTAPAVTDSYPTIELRGMPNDSSATMKIFDYQGKLVPNMFNMTTYPVGFGDGTDVGIASIVSPALEIGYNQVCVFVAGNVDRNVSEGANCIEIGYAP
jgi:hypothetical protein